MLSYYTNDSISANNDSYYDALEGIINKHINCFIKRKEFFQGIVLSMDILITKKFNKNKKFTKVIFL